MKGRVRTDMKDKLFLALMEAQRAHGHLSLQGFQKLNLSEGQPKTLYILLRAEGCVQKELAEMARVRPASIAIMYPIRWTRQVKGIA